MKINKGVNIDKVREYKVGDLFEIEFLDLTGSAIRYIYQLINVYDKYMLIRFDDASNNYQSYSGEYSSIEDLFEDVDDDDKIVAHYSSDEYELTLTKK